MIKENIMHGLIKDLSNFILKFCWIIVICALAGGVLGYFTKSETSTTERYNYQATAKISIDVKELEERTIIDVGSSSGESSKSLFSGYNTAYSLLPTFKNKFMSKNLVLQKVCDEYKELTGEEITVSKLESGISMEFPESALLFDVTYTSDSEAESAKIIELLCKWGVHNINQYSDLIKVKLSSIDFNYATVMVSGSDTRLTEFKKAVLDNVQNIYTSIKPNLSEDDYVLLRDIQNGLSFSEISNGSYVVKFSGNSLKCAELVIGYVKSGAIDSTDLTLGDVKTKTDHLEEVYISRTSNTVTTGINRNNTLLLTVFGAIGSLLVLVLVFISKPENFEKLKIKKAKADQDDQKKSE